jgi:hypothetical protein
MDNLDNLIAQLVQQKKQQPALCQKTFQTLKELGLPCVGSRFPKRQLAWANSYTPTSSVPSTPTLAIRSADLSDWRGELSVSDGSKLKVLEANGATIDEHIQNLNAIHKNIADLFGGPPTPTMIASISASHPDLYVLFQDMFNQSANLQFQIRMLMDQDRNVMDGLWDNGLLSPAAIKAHLAKSLQLSSQLERLQLFADELRMINGAKPVADFVPAKMTVVERRKTGVYSQKKTMADSITVQLDKLAHWNVQVISKVSATLDPPIHSNDQTKPYQDQEISFDEHGRASFTSIFFGGNFKLATTRFRFHCTIQWEADGQLKQQQIHVLDPDHFTVSSNTIQWEKAEGALFRATLKDMTFIGFLNTLQARFIMQIHKAKASQSTYRYLSKSDLEWVRDWHHTYAVNQMIQSPVYTNKWNVAVHGFDQFWKWWGKFVNHIRFHKYFRIMWNEGWLLGPAHRSDVDRLIQSYGPNTFALRFSERKEDTFVISVGSPSHGMGTSVLHYELPKIFYKNSKESNVLQHVASLTCGYFLKVCRSDEMSGTITRVSRIEEMKCYIKTGPVDGEQCFYLPMFPQ